MIHLKPFSEQVEKADDSCSSSCGCSTNSNSQELSMPDDSNATEPMDIIIDGQVIKANPTDNNIVDVANRANIAIPAACYRAKRKKGCCHGCVVEIDGEQKFACSTLPKNGMNIVVDRADLKVIRKQNLKEYNEGIKSGNFCKCSSTVNVDLNKSHESNEGGSQMNMLNNDDIRSAVRENYGKVATSTKEGCGCSTSSCCPTSAEITAEDISRGLGYSGEEVTDVPEGANMGLGCGNPQAIASLKAGETVLDLGSGGGFDSFLAARTVGEEGSVIGVDMTPEMITKARRNTEKIGLLNVDFRLGEIENLPVADGVVDVIISNCVINLSPEKEKVFMEAFRVLKPGGRLAISDVVKTAEMPESVKNNTEMHTGCIAGASSIQTITAMLQKAGFENIQIVPKDESRTFISEWAPGTKIENYVVSATIEAIRPDA